eukprot:GCRY01003601.1.p1 GENE.GCRY01003601.1~~GCRY01003601.1.p1  ORF type:complete len:266 (+),score=35.09 GCRY01003601.1:74-871(+)
MDASSSLSKNALKKQKKMETREQKRIEWKQRRTENKKMNKQLRHKRRLLSLQDEHSKSEKKEHFKKKRKEENREKMSSGLQICVDLSWGSSQCDGEIRSLATQIKTIYGENLMMKKPFSLCLSNFGGSAAIALNRIGGFENWVITKSSSPVEAMFPSGRITYLTPDAKEILNEVDDNAVYVVGGLCDYNRSQKTTLDYAEKHNFKTAALPTEKYLRRDAVRILTVNQAVMFLAYYFETENWDIAASKALPARKLLPQFVRENKLS